MVQQFLQIQLKTQPSQTRRGDLEEDKQLHAILCDGKPHGLMNELFLKEKKGKTIFDGWMMKDLESQSGILLEEKVIVSIYKSRDTSRLSVTNKY